MMRKIVIQGFTAAFAVTTSAFTAQAQQPNIVFILADDMGYGDVSALNPESKIRTQHLDAMSEQGIRFTDAHSCSSVSTPSRYGILTGRYAFRTHLKTGTLNGYSEPLIPADRTTIASLLKREGYTTACIGKWHLGWDWARNDKNEIDYAQAIANGPLSRGFDYFFGIAASLDMPPYVYVEQDRPTAIPNRISKEGKGLLLFRSGPQAPDLEPEDCLPNFTRRAVEYIETRGKENKPFFLYLPITAPHTPILPSEAFRGKSGLSPYGDFVLMVDDMVGQINDALRTNGLDKNTIVVFTSDNGCYRGAGMNDMEEQGHYPSYIYRGAKSDIFDGGHRVPLIISWGDRYRQQTYNGILSLTDFFATFAEMIDTPVQANEGEDSHSFWPLLSGYCAPGRTDIIHNSINGSFALREGKWKLIFCGDSGGWSYPSLPGNADIVASLPKFQLYNLETDPGETTNLIDQEPGIAKRLTTNMRNYLLDGRSTPGAKQNNDSSDKWEQIKPILKQ